MNTYSVYDSSGYIISCGKVYSFHYKWQHCRRYPCQLEVNGWMFGRLLFACGLLMQLPPVTLHLPVDHLLSRGRNQWAVLELSLKVAKWQLLMLMQLPPLTLYLPVDHFLLRSRNQRHLNLVCMNNEQCWNFLTALWTFPRQTILASDIILILIGQLRV